MEILALTFIKKHSLFRVGYNPKSFYQRSIHVRLIVWEFFVYLFHMIAAGIEKRMIFRRNILSV